MRVSIVAKSQLSEKQLRYLTDRISAPEHALDTGPRTVWHNESYGPNYYAIVLTETQTPIGTLYASGPDTHIDAAWWIDSRYRGEGYGSEAIDEFAALLKGKGVTGIGRILIDTYQGRYHDASSKLCARLKAHFALQPAR